MLRLLRQPRWALGLAIVLVACTGFAAAGFWQLDRLEQRRDRNDRIEAALAADPVALEPGLPEFTRVETRGHLKANWEFSLPLQSRNGQAGLHILMVIETEGGLYLVDRGWVPLDAADEYPRDGGFVNLEAIVRLPTTGRLTGASEGGRPSISGRDPTAVDAELELDLEGEVLQLVSQAPAPDPAPLPPLLPEITEGNHLLYAVQWFSFVAIVVVGFVVLVRKRASELGEPLDDVGAGE